MEAVPHIELLREIQPLVLDGLNFSKVLFMLSLFLLSSYRHMPLP